MLAYLVIRDGAKWSDVFRLVPGRTVTIGRAPGNEIVLKDEQASRRHAELFLTGGEWTLRDLDSRNGTRVGDQRIQGDYTLKVGDIICIAHSQMEFVDDLSEALSGPATPTRRSANQEEETVAGATMTDLAGVAGLNDFSDSSIFDSHEPTHITHRRNETRFLADRDDDEAGVPRVGIAARMLCRLAFELANQTDVRTLANKALDGLFEGVKVDAGAVLLAPDDVPIEPNGSNMQVVAARTDVQPSYHRVSSFIASSVLRDGEAVLARNVAGDSTLGTRDSKGEIHTTSVICAPLRHEKSVIGFIHLYSTEAQRVPDPDDLEFTLAVADNVATALRNLRRQSELAENLSTTQNEIAELRSRLGVESEIVGRSTAMEKIHEDISRAAPSRVTVLIRGESGSGKELVARAVHYSSPRKKGPFICLNCAALSESLLESELFGHEKGAFTGATERKTGKFEAADSGTLMLDEIGEMSPSIQAKFLRVLEGHPFERVGGAKSIKVDVRVIAATNRDLVKAVEAGQFRRDLYFRLHVVEILVAPLRKRRADIIELAQHFLERFNVEMGRTVTGFTPAAVHHLENYHWPGNVRELKNVIERAVVLTRSNVIDTPDLSLSSLASASESGEVAKPDTYQPMSLAEIEKRHILATLNSTSWNKTRTSGILGVPRSTLDRKIAKYKLKRESGFRTG